MEEKKFKILFLYHSAVNWYNIEYLYDRCLLDNELEVTVAVVPQLTSTNVMRPSVVKQQEVQEDLVRRGLINEVLDLTKMEDIKTTNPNYDLLATKKIPYVLGRDIHWSPGCFDMVVFGYPYEMVMYPAFHMAEIKKYVRKVVYLPYGLDISSGATIEKQSYFQPIHTHGDALFYPSESARLKFIMSRPDAENRVFATSIPRFDRLYRIQEHVVDETLKAKVNGRFCVLINHHFTFYINRWSTFDFTFGDYFDFFIENIDRFACIWRPHPNIARELVSSGFFSSEQVKNIFKAIEEAGIIVDSSVNHIDAFYLSDCFITDTSSMFIDYIGTGKPMIIQNNNQGFHQFDKYDLELMNFYYRGDCSEDALDFVENIYAGKDPKKIMRIMAQKRFAVKFDGQATERIYHKMKELLQP